MKPIDALQRWQRGRGLSTTAVLAVGAALAAMVAVLVAFAVLVEDVTRRNGLEVSDPSHLQVFTSHRTSQLVDAARVITDAGAITVLLPLAVVAAGILLWRRVPLAFAVAPLIGLLAAGVATAVLKQAVGRARPPLGLRLVNETEPSFPSGHTADGTAFWVGLALVVAVVLLRRPIARFAAVLAGTALSGAVGLSRLVLGVHWPTDVLAGWALGTAFALAVVLLATLVRHLNPGGPQPAGWHRRVPTLLGTRRRSRRARGVLGLTA